MNLITSLEEKILDAFFPKTCLGCRVTGSWMCPACLYSLPVQFQEEKLPSYTLSSVFSFHTPLIREALHLLKYAGISDIATHLGEVASPFITWPVKSVIIPVPTSRSRLKERGYNQAELIAKALSRGEVTAGLKRKEGASLVGKNRDERLNLDDSLFSPDPKLIIKPETPYILVDDVCTTGATISACVKVLQEAGVRNLSVFTLARA